MLTCKIWSEMSNGSFVFSSEPKPELSPLQPPIHDRLLYVLTLTPNDAQQFATS